MKVKKCGEEKSFLLWPRMGEEKKESGEQKLFNLFCGLGNGITLLISGQSGN
jgi:hypothetical protein